MLCAARAEVGPLSQSFWVLWDRSRGEQLSHTSLRPGSREVRMDGDRVVIDAAGLRAELHLGAAAPIEAICPSGPGWGWTRKAAGVPIEATVELPGRRVDVSGFGVDDQSAGYQARAPAGTGRPASAAPPTGGRWPGTSSRASTTRRRAASGGSGSTASPTSLPRSASTASPRSSPPNLCHPGGYKSWGSGERVAAGVRGGVRAGPRRELRAAALHLPAPVRDLQRQPRRDRAGRGPRRHGVTRRPLVGGGPPARLTRCRRSGGAPRAGRGRRRRGCGRSRRGSRPGR